MVRVWKQVAFQALSLWVDVGHQSNLLHCRGKKVLPRGKSRLFQPGRYLKNARALRNGYHPGKNIPSRDPRINFRYRHWMIESIFTGPQRSSLGPAQQIEGKPAANYARILQLMGDPRSGRARRQLDKCLMVRPKWHNQQPRSRSSYKKQYEESRQKGSCRARTLFLSAVSSAACHSVAVYLSFTRDASNPTGDSLPLRLYRAQFDGAGHFCLGPGALS